MEEIKQLIAYQQERLFFYSPYNFLRELGIEKHLRFVNHKLLPWLEEKDTYFIFRTEVDHIAFYYLYQHLSWDSNYFNHPTHKLFTVLYPEVTYAQLLKSVSNFKNHLASKGGNYCFIDIPVEDIILIQALTESRFRLTETRLTYYQEQVRNFEYPRFSVRKALETDIPNLRKIAGEARNDYDRYHADTFFSTLQADAYLESYAEACVKGLCETVLVPDEPNLPADAFLAISHLQTDSEFLDALMARVVLTAVGPTCKGWHVKLVAETIQYAKSNNCQFVLMTTQATNRAVFRTSEKLGFRLGSTTHILAITI